MRKPRKAGPPKIIMKNISINLPNNYEENIQYLIDNRIIASRSAAIRMALRDFLIEEYYTNLELLGFNGNGGVKNESE